ncbi:MAG TPA: protein-glutamate O-methyltransferase CheR [Egibacteraceae bacterium]|nr:protein-glutamate O-methyltransferase CheR [Egibacteraceae bacterium]
MKGRAALVGYVEERSGLAFAGVQLPRMTEALEESAARRGQVADAAYQAVLEQDETAFDELMDALTVPETHFFREASAVALLQEVALPAVAQGRPAGGIGVWCVGCASGEEAYTVAMAASEVELGDQVRILGTDVSPRALAKAERAVYGRWSLRGVDEDRRRLFVADGPRYRVSESIRGQVRFRVMNLLAGPPGRFEIVLCRNMLIYFTAEAVQRAAAVLHAALRPGGWLFTGASDPLLTVPGLDRVATPHGVAYRRAADAPAGPPVAQAGANRSTALPRRAIPEGARAPMPVPHPPRSPARIPSVEEGARGEEAPAGAERANGHDPLDALGWYVTAAVHLEAGRPADAVAAARAALFLHPGLSGAAALLHHARRALAGPR